MKKLMSYVKGLCFGSLSMVSVIVTLWPVGPLFAAEFFCSSGNVTCLIAAINDANALTGEHIINLEPGIYTLQLADNTTDGPNGLPSIRRSIQILATAEDPPTVIERDPDAPGFRIFHISLGGELSLDGVIVERGGPGGSLRGPAIFNRGSTSLRDSIVTNALGEAGAIHNIGILNMFRSIVSDNSGFHEGGGIHNEAGGVVLVENSTIGHNLSADGGGIKNIGSLVVRNSSIVFNRTDSQQGGGGIANFGSVEIVNSTIAKNEAGVSGGGGVSNGGGGRISMTNSTVRENHSGIFGLNGFRAGGIANNDTGVLQLQNTIVAGNTISGSFAGPDCSGTITSIGNNLMGDPSGCSIDLQLSDLTGDPGLDSLVGAGGEDPPGAAFYPVLEGSRVINNANSTACLETDQVGNPRVGSCDIGAIEFQQRRLVAIDVRPLSDANKINPNSSHNINVAIFSVNGFDATAVDPNTVRFGATGTEASPVHVGRRDVDGDGKRDIVLRFQIQDTDISCGDATASLMGETSNGIAFIGSAPITTTRCAIKN
jgi:hypothetical protein